MRSRSISEAALEKVTIEVEGTVEQVGIHGRDLRGLDTDTKDAATRDLSGAASVREVAGRGGGDVGVGIAAATEAAPESRRDRGADRSFTPWPSRPGVPVVVCLVGDGAEAMRKQVPKWAPVVVVDD